MTFKTGIQFWHTKTYWEGLLGTSGPNRRSVKFHLQQSFNHISGEVHWVQVGHMVRACRGASPKAVGGHQGESGHQSEEGVLIRSFWSAGLRRQLMSTSSPGRMQPQQSLRQKLQHWRSSLRPWRRTSGDSGAPSMSSGGGSSATLTLCMVGMGHSWPWLRTLWVSRGKPSRHQSHQCTFHWGSRVWVL